MSVALMSLTWKGGPLDRSRYVFLALCDRANDQGEDCFPSIRTITKDTCLSQRCVQTTLATLKQGPDAWIATEQSGGGSSITRYRVNVVRLCREALASGRALSRSDVPFITSVLGDADSAPVQHSHQRSSCGEAVQKSTEGGAENVSLYRVTILNHPSTTPSPSADVTGGLKPTLVTTKPKKAATLSKSKAEAILAPYPKSHIAKVEITLRDIQSAHAKLMAGNYHGRPKITSEEAETFLAGQVAAYAAVCQAAGSDRYIKLSSNFFKEETFLVPSTWPKPSGRPFGSDPRPFREEFEDPKEKRRMREAAVAGGGR